MNEELDTRLVAVEARVEELEHLVARIGRVVLGDEETHVLPLIDRIEQLNERLAVIERLLQRASWMVAGMTAAAGGSGGLLAMVLAEVFK